MILDLIFDGTTALLYGRFCLLGRTPLCTSSPPILAQASRIRILVIVAHIYATMIGDQANSMRRHGK